jgi:hypothetical protein
MEANMKLLMSCLALLICVTTNAQKQTNKWKLVATDSESQKWFVNTEEITTTRIKTKRAWAKIQIPLPNLEGIDLSVFRNPAPEEQAKFKNLPKLKNHTILLYEFDCGQKRFKILSSTDYADDGTVINTSDSKSVWKYAVPDSVGYDLLKFVCADRRRG